MHLPFSYNPINTFTIKMFGLALAPNQSMVYFSSMLDHAIYSIGTNFATPVALRGSGAGAFVDGKVKLYNLRIFLCFPIIRSKGFVC